MKLFTFITDPPDHESNGIQLSGSQSNRKIKETSNFLYHISWIIVAGPKYVLKEDSVQSDPFGIAITN